MRRLAHPIAVLAALGAQSCERERPRPEEARCITWEAEARVLLEQRCSTCHSGPAPAGDWDVSTYHGTIGGGSDQAPNAVAGDPDSLMLQRIEAGQADEAHRPFAEAYAPLARWVVDCRLALRDSAIHAPGIQNPADPDFHGLLLRDRDYDFGFCAKCHGERFEGGGADSSCVSCHEEGPTDCSTCHGDGMDAEHQAHGAFDCDTCHQVPERWDDAGHIRTAAGVLDAAPAEVRFAELATASLSHHPREAAASWDGERCSNVYCHGGTFEDAAAELATPGWRAGEEMAACGTCHGLPPSDHASDQCMLCHQRVADADSPFHLDGLLQLGTSDEGCQGCHGTPDAPAPPRSLAGEIDRTFLGVGAHRVHLEPRLNLRGPMACSDCHLVPNTALEEGHLDTALPAEVFPPAIAASSLAFSRGASPRWDPSTGTCSDAYCHGAASPVWNEVGTQAFCGTCHGIPPASAPHDPAWNVYECARCHPTAVDSFGNPTFEGRPGATRSEHLDGEIDL